MNALLIVTVFLKYDSKIKGLRKSRFDDTSTSFLNATILMPSVIKTGQHYLIQTTQEL